MREPWWRKQNGHWYLEVDGKQVRLSKEPDPDGGSRKEPPPPVQNEWHKFMREGIPSEMQFGDLVAQFLASLPEGDNKDNSRRQLSRFERFVGREAKVSQIKPIKFSEYIRKHPNWKPSSVRTFVNRVHACINWGVRQGLLDKNPISSTPGYHREGRYERRRGVISEADRRLAEEHAGPVFRPVLVALRETGARPSEICRARVEKVDLAGSFVMVPNKTAHQTGNPERKIYLSPEAKRTIEACIGSRTEGFVFLNSFGKPWNCQSLKKRWDALRAATGVKGTLRTYRRTFISSAINEANVNPVIVASLAGHNLDVMMKHYYEMDPKAMLAAVAKITGHAEETKPSRKKK
jgi:integrase